MFVARAPSEHRRIVTPSRPTLQETGFLHVVMRAIALREAQGGGDADGDGEEGVHLAALAVVEAGDAGVGGAGGVHGADDFLRAGRFDGLPGFDVQRGRMGGA